ncbi:MAG TPA: hypothetical protein VHW02_08890 [Rhizomicrobium sp.]|jgi:hypothetical protein|nr:hypothetical protein [Rhizomicrobium sp.]
MLKLISRAAFAAALMSSTAAVAQMGSYTPPPSTGGTAAPAAQKPAASHTSAGKVSSAVGKPLQDAITAAQAKDFQGALAKIKEAQAVPSPSDFDTYKINQVLAFIEVNLKDYVAADTAYEGAADSPAIPDEDKPQILHDALLLSAQQKHWDKTVKYGQQLEALNKLDDELESDMAVAYYSLNDKANATKYAQMSVAAAKAAGKQPQQSALQITLNGQASSNNQAGAEQTLEQLAMQYNSPDAWGQLIDVGFGAKGMNDITAIDLYRLKFTTKAMKGDDAKLAGRLANQIGFFGDAVAFLSQGGGGADLSKARSDAAKDQASLTSQIAQAKKGNGEVAVKVAEGLYGYGRFAEAEALARDAMSKNGMKYPYEAPLLVGMSLVGQGKFADAVQAFGQVSGGEAAQKVAHLWTLYAQRQTSGAPAAAAPAQPAPQQ